jgi:peptidylprolyl isomerase
MAAKAGDMVKIHYTGRLADRSVFDQSEDHDLLEFKLGEGTVLPGLEAQIVGMEAGEEKTIALATADAYGEEQTDLVFEVQKESVPSDLELEVGMQLEISEDSGSGDSIPVTVIKIDDKTITLDANHPLAGEDLTFELKLVEVRPGP